MFNHFNNGKRKHAFEVRSWSLGSKHVLVAKKFHFMNCSLKLRIWSWYRQLCTNFACIRSLSAGGCDQAPSQKCIFNLPSRCVRKKHASCFSRENTNLPWKQDEMLTSLSLCGSGCKGSPPNRLARIIKDRMDLYMLLVMGCPATCLNICSPPGVKSEPVVQVQHFAGV